MFAKKYKKGMADAAKAYEAFGKKQEDALKHILEEVREGKRNLEDALKDLDGNINNLYDYLQSKEKANLYTVYTPFNIKDLDSEEKLFLLGALLSLVKDNEPNENQQKFIRSIQKYLDIKELPFDVNPLAIENIENISSQKAIYQVVLEYLILQDGDSYDETDLQQEFLESFNLNSKTRATITNHVEIIYSATGAEGLAEKYGYIPTVPNAVLLNVSKDKNRNIVAETNDYILTCSSDIYTYEKSSLFICYNKKTGESFVPFTNSQLLTDYSSDIIIEAMAIGNTLWFSFANTVCCKMDSTCLLLDINNDSVKEISIDGEIIAFTKNHIVYANEFYNQSYANLYDYNIDANVSNEIEQKVLYSRNCSYSSTYYDSLAVYYMTQKDNSILIHKFIFGSDVSNVICSFEGKERMISGLNGAFSSNVALNPISFYVDILNYTIYMLFNSKDETYELYTCELKLNSSLQLLNKGIFIYGTPYARQSNDCNYRLLFLTENDIDDVESSPSFILKVLDFKNRKLQTLTRGCGYAELHQNHQTRGEDKLSKLFGGIIDEIDDCIDGMYKSNGKDRPSCSFFSNHGSIIALSDYVLCNVGKYEFRRQFNCFVNLLDGSINNIESSKLDD